LSVKDVCDYLGIGRDTIYKWIAAKSLPAYRLGRLWISKNFLMSANGMTWRSERCSIETTCLSIIEMWVEMSIEPKLVVKYGEVTMKVSGREEKKICMI